MRLELAIVPCYGAASEAASCGDGAVWAQRLGAASAVAAGSTCYDFNGQNRAQEWMWLSWRWARVVQDGEQNLHSCCCVFGSSPDVTAVSREVSVVIWESYIYVSMWIYVFIGKNRRVYCICDSKLLVFYLESDASSFSCPF